MRIEINDQDCLADRGQSGAEIDRGRRLADAALLIGKNDDAHLVIIFHLETLKRISLEYYTPSNDDDFSFGIGQAIRESEVEANVSMSGGQFVCNPFPLQKQANRPFFEYRTRVFKSPPKDASARAETTSK